MVNKVGRVHKLGRYNRQRYVFTNIPLNTTLRYSNSHDKYNENIDVRSKDTITLETQSNGLFKKTLIEKN